MSIKAQTQNIKDRTEELHAQAAIMREQNRLEDALSLYLNSIESDESQSESVYANAIAISTQIGRFDLANKLIRRANTIHANSTDILTATGVFFQQTNHPERATECYQKSIELNPKQPEWVYKRLIAILTQSSLHDRATQVREAAKKEFSQSQTWDRPSESKVERDNTEQIQNIQPKKAIEQPSVTPEIREVPECVEKYVDHSVSNRRRQLTDSSIVEQFSILLNQMLRQGDQEKAELDVDALVQCLAEIKTDIHYLKAKIINSPAEAVDPQAKQTVELEKIGGLSKPIPLKCDLKKRIVGSGWYDAEKFGRWSGPSTVSSLVFPYPPAGKYKFEMIVRSESKINLLQTLKININDCELETHIVQKEQNFFPAIVSGDFVISSEQEQSFLAIDLIVGETLMPLATDSRLMGLLIEEISLIPSHLVAKQSNEV